MTCKPETDNSDADPWRVASDLAVWGFLILLGAAVLMAVVWWTCKIALALEGP